MASVVRKNNPSRNTEKRTSGVTPGFHLLAGPARSNASRTVRCDGVHLPTLDFISMAIGFV